MYTFLVPEKVPSSATSMASQQSESYGSKQDAIEGGQLVSCGSLSTLAVIPVDERSSPAFVKVHPKSLLTRASPDSALVDSRFSEVLPSTQDALERVLDRALGALRDGQNAALLTVGPSGSATHEVWANLVNGMLPNIFEHLLPQCPVAHISACTISNAGKQIVDAQTLLPVAQLHALSTVEIHRANSALQWAELLEALHLFRLRQRALAPDATMFVRLEFPSDQCELLLVDADASAQTLHLLTLALRSRAPASAERTIAPRIPAVFAIEPYLPPNANMTVVVVADPSPNGVFEPSAMIRTLRFASDLTAAYSSPSNSAAGVARPLETVSEQLRHHRSLAAQPQGPPVARSPGHQRALAPKLEPGGHPQPPQQDVTAASRFVPSLHYERSASQGEPDGALMSAVSVGRDEDPSIAPLPQARVEPSVPTRQQDVAKSQPDHPPSTTKLYSWRHELLADVFGEKTGESSAVRKGTPMLPAVPAARQSTVFAGRNESSQESLAAVSSVGFPLRLVSAVPSGQREVGTPSSIGAHDEREHSTPRQTQAAPKNGASERADRYSHQDSEKQGPPTRMPSSASDSDDRRTLIAKLMTAEHSWHEAEAVALRFRDEAFKWKGAFDEASAERSKWRAQCEEFEEELKHSQKRNEEMDQLVRTLTGKLNRDAENSTSAAVLKSQVDSLTKRNEELEQFLEEARRATRILENKEKLRLRENTLRRIAGGSSSTSHRASSGPSASRSARAATPTKPVRSSEKADQAVRELQRRLEEMTSQNRELQGAIEQLSAVRSTPKRTPLESPAKDRSSKSDDASMRAVASSAAAAAAAAVEKKLASAVKEIEVLRSQVEYYEQEVARIRLEKESMQRIIATHPRSASAGESAMAVARAMLKGCELAESKIGIGGHLEQHQQHLDLNQSNRESPRSASERSWMRSPIAETLTKLRTAIEDIVGRQAVAVAPSVASDKDAELLMQILTFEIDRVSHLRAFVPAFAQILSSVEKGNATT